MKTTTRFKVAIPFLVIMLAATVFASVNSIFSVKNETSANLGEVTIYNGDGTSTIIYVPGPGEFTSSIKGRPISAVIEKQVVPNDGTTTKIILPSSEHVQAWWTGNQIVVIDQSIVQDTVKGRNSK